MVGLCMTLLSTFLSLALTCYVGVVIGLPPVWICSLVSIFFAQDVLHRYFRW